MQFVINRLHKIVKSLPCCGRDNKQLYALLVAKSLKCVNLLLCCNISLICNGNLRSLRKLKTEIYKLLIYKFKVFYRVSALTAGNINHMQKQATTLNMAQKVVS